MIMMVDDMVLSQVCEENGQLDVLAHKRLILYLVKRLSMRKGLAAAEVFTLFGHQKCALSESTCSRQTFYATTTKSTANQSICMKLLLLKI